ncbi:DUF3093 domain-containing protein [Microlunatus elymi]|uniref:DUF3093 domain-containing protein n=1 Tax=Microlunatus elymi TaxID=2596828 RepID=UPI00143DBD73|nr:DUF3093 domain-containing protein [Microlunatus elymi]
MSEPVPNASPGVSSPAVSNRRQPGGTLPSHRELLWVPVGWWILAGLFALSMFVAVLFYLGPWIAIGTFVVLMAIITAVFVPYGRLTIRTDEDRLWVGRANIEWRYIIQVRALDEQQTRQRRGPRADARAFLTLRPYLSRAVELTISDAEDPTPYWLVSSRRADQFANAVRARISPESGDTRDSVER